MFKEQLFYRVKCLPVFLIRGVPWRLTGSNLQCPQHLSLGLPHSKYLMHAQVITAIFIWNTMSYKPQQKKARTYSCIWLKGKSKPKHRKNINPQLFLQTTWIFLPQLLDMPKTQVKAPKPMGQLVILFPSHAVSPPAQAHLIFHAQLKSYLNFPRWPQLAALSLPYFVLSVFHALVHLIFPKALLS